MDVSWKEPTRQSLSIWPWPGLIVKIRKVQATQAKVTVWPPPPPPMKTLCKPKETTHKDPTEWDKMLVKPHKTYQGSL